MLAKWLLRSLAINEPKAMCIYVILSHRVDWQMVTNVSDKPATSISNST
jgi:hypothetical protein